MGRSRMVLWTHGGDPGRVGRSSGKSGIGWGTLREVRDGLGDPREFPGGVGGPSGRSGTGRGTFREVVDRLGDSRGGSGMVGGP